MITLIGLGAGDADLLSRGAERALRDASEQRRAGTGDLLLRTARHPVVDSLTAWGLEFEPLDRFYETGADFASVYASLANTVLERALSAPNFHVAYAVPGHPLMGEAAAAEILRRAESQNIPTRIVSSGSFVEAVLSTLKLSVNEGLDVCDALALQIEDTISDDGSPLPNALDVSRGLLLFQVFDQASASHAKLCLMRHYPDEWEVRLVRQAGVAKEESVRRIPLYQLDREPVDHLTALYVPPLPPDLRRPDLGALAGIMARLRAPNGCPWDREQTHQSLRRYFIEETYEVLEAIDAEDPDLLCEELGDALLQVVFHSQLATEEGVFTLDDVLRAICEKLVRRHPHVFGDLSVADSDEVLKNWEQIKRAEKANEPSKRRDSLLDGVPKGLPALMQAMDISKRVIKVGFEWNCFADVWAKLEEEVEELHQALSATEPNLEAIASEIGDLLFTVVQVARWHKLDPEEALRNMVKRFSDRFRYIETQAKAQGRNLNEMSLAEMDALWDEAKRTLA